MHSFWCHHAQNNWLSSSIYQILHLVHCYSSSSPSLFVPSSSSFSPFSSFFSSFPSSRRSIPLLLCQYLRFCHQYLDYFAICNHFRKEIGEKRRKIINKIKNN